MQRVASLLYPETPAMTQRPPGFQRGLGERGEGRGCSRHVCAADHGAMAPHVCPVRHSGACPLATDRCENAPAHSRTLASRGECSAPVWDPAAPPGHSDLQLAAAHVAQHSCGGVSSCPRLPPVCAILTVGSRTTQGVHTAVAGTQASGTAPATRFGQFSPPPGGRRSSREAGVLSGPVLMEVTTWESGWGYF